jgi:MFS family permease
MFGWHFTFLSIVPFAVAVTIMIAKFVKENKVQLITPTSNQKSIGKNEQMSPSIDIKGALVLSITIISFLIALTLVQSGINSKTLPQVGIAFIVSAISLAIFVLIERRVTSPLVDMRLLKDKTLLPSYMILMATGITMFMAYPAIVQLVRSPTEGCSRCSKCTAAFYDYVPSFRKRHTDYYKSNRKTKSHHNRYHNQPNRVGWTIDVSLYKTRSIY